MKGLQRKEEKMKAEERSEREMMKLTKHRKRSEGEGKKGRSGNEKEVHRERGRKSMRREREGGRKREKLRSCEERADEGRGYKVVRNGLILDARKGERESLTSKGEGKGGDRLSNEAE